MLGAIAGDIIGSVFEPHWRRIKRKEFDLFSKKSKFTDDTVLTVAVAEAILQQKAYVYTIKDYYRRYPKAGYGKTFREWGASDSVEPYHSWGNGSAMRVSAVGFAFEDLETVLQEAERSAAVTHNHPEGIKGAQATAAAIYLGRRGRSKAEIETYIEATFGYDLSLSLEEIRPQYQFDSSCQGSVPQAITAFLESTDFEDAIRNAVSLGGDSDTQACIAGGIAQGFYGGVPERIAQETWARLDADLQQVVEAFMATYQIE
ncbi:ADP-ribosylglycohydrolase family protein [Acaryochloris sp. IP29b_bin.148]|uniref:ADP-ribosylglycohydrolase family protein n=1 Tax=Acaryochloris sp. IP29b_bin.148 TaxID=2969218 RepID=UPI0026028888|nr:ADP-ribosylglycohydrolase family protein [Acaryochloris sp. IP29b_bin.148]